VTVTSPFLYFRDRRLRILMLFADLFVIGFAYYAAFYLRFEGILGREYIDIMLRTGPILIIAGFVFLLVFEVYRGMWQYASLNDLAQIIKAITATSAIFILLLYLIRHDQVPRSVIVIQWLISLVGIGGLRFSARFLRKFLSASKRRIPVLVVGAGDAGEMIVRQMLNNPQYGYDLIGVIDDDPRKKNLRLHGVKVLGGRDRIPTIVQRRRVEEIIIAVPTATGEQMRGIVDVCKSAGVRYRTLPGPRELVDGKVSLTQLREVKLEDLLGREPIAIDTTEISRVLTGNCVLVTGAGGSIGSELCRQILEYRPSQLICLERAENPLYFLEQELRQTKYAKEHRERVVPLICDIGNRPKLEEVFRKYRPHAVFHAAAHKHVPLMESHPEEAILNNVIGTLNVLEVSANSGVAEFILISTDKAVAPTSVMGASKRVAELLVQAYANAHSAKTRCITVRFGNVIGSNGSVIPLFQQQIARGGPVTVTHPDMRRFFMTIPEAVQLITQAATMGVGGEVFILDMGKPIRILDMAEQLITLSGYEPGTDIEIEFIGLRPGEKLEEVLWHKWETPAETRHSKIFAAMTEPKAWDTIIAQVEELRDAAERMDRKDVIVTLREIIPDYTPMKNNGDHTPVSVRREPQEAAHTT